MPRTPEERGIFSYFDGTRDRHVDPLVIRRKFIDHPEFSWDSDPAIIDNDSEMGRTAYARTLQAMQDVFEIKPLADDLTGLTEEEQLQLWLEFVQFLAKKNETVLPLDSPTLPQLFTSIPSDSIIPSTSG